MHTQSYFIYEDRRRVHERLAGAADEAAAGEGVERQGDGGASASSGVNDAHIATVTLYPRSLALVEDALDTIDGAAARLFINGTPTVDEQTGQYSFTDEQLSSLDALFRQITTNTHRIRSACSISF